VAEQRSVETVRREIGAERQQLVVALEQLRAETIDVKRAAARQAKRAALLLVAVSGVAVATRMLVRRLRD
jgi:hypothetical protein